MLPKGFVGMYFILKEMLESIRAHYMFYVKPGQCYVRFIR